MVATYLDDIIAAHRAAASDDRRDTDGLVSTALAMPAARGLSAALRRRSGAGRLAVLAEVKRRSPSKGDLNPGLDPGALAAQYAAGGAAGLSVLTDAEFFGGSSADLVAARRSVGIPVLRKDFVVAPNDVADARLMGADAVLLIVAALRGTELADLAALAGRIGLDVLVEVHDRPELAAALDIGATMIGVNQRDLVTFEVDPERAVALAPQIPRDVVAIAESGIGGPADAASIAAAGFDAVLVGESLVRSADAAAATASLAEIPVSVFAGARGR